MGEGAALSGRLPLDRHHLRPVDPPAAGLEIRRRAGHRKLRRRPGHLQADRPLHPDRQPPVRRRQFPAHRHRPAPGRRRRRRLSEHRRRRRQGPSPHAGATRLVREPGHPDRSVVRRPPLRPLRLPGGRHIQAGRHRPGASPLVRELGARRLLHQLGQEPGLGRPAAARVRPRLERQAPAPRRRTDRQPQHPDPEHPAVGL
ncbi:hypothetical protein D3C80_1125100 [compost metagenome]